MLIYVIWLPHLVRYTTSTSKDHDDLHEGRPKVIKGQIVYRAIWISDFVRRTTESNLGQLCPQ